MLCRFARGGGGLDFARHALIEEIEKKKAAASRFPRLAAGRCGHLAGGCGAHARVHLQPPGSDPPGVPARRW
eukprot:gene5765-3768_t